MAVSSGFFNSVSGDRTYDAEQFGDLFDGIIRDGVFMYSSYNTELPFIPKIVPETPMQITLGPGKAWFMRTWTISTIAEPFAFAPGEGYGRYDAVVLNVDKRQVNRRNTLSVVKGEARPTPVWPTLANETNYRQYPLVYVYIPAGATSLTNSSLDYHIGKSPLDVPFVTGPLEILDPSALFASWQATWEEWYFPFKANAISDWSTFLSDKLAEFAAFVQARQNEFNAFMAVSKTTFDDFMTDSGNTFDEWMAERDIMFYSWFNQVQIDWQTWFDSIKADWQTWFDDNASQFDSWWKGAEDAFNAWLAEMQGVISGTEYTELANAISDVNPLFTATATTEDGIVYVDIVVPQGGPGMYQNIRKTATNTRYPFYFVAPVRHTMQQVYRFTDAINGIDKLPMTIRTPDMFPLAADATWQQGTPVSLYRNGNNFYFVGAKKADSASVVIAGSVAPTWRKLLTARITTNANNFDIGIDYVASPTQSPATTQVDAGQIIGHIALRSNMSGEWNTSSCWMSISSGNNLFEAGYDIQLVPVYTDASTFELWAVINTNYQGFVLTELAKYARYDNPTETDAIIVEYVRSAFGGAMDGPADDLPRMIMKYQAVTRTDFDGKVDKLLPPTAPSAGSSYVYEVVESGKEQRQLLATSGQGTSSYGGLVKRNQTDGSFSVVPATAATQPPQLQQVTNMVEAGMAVEEFYRTKTRVIGTDGNQPGRYWIAPITIHSIRGTSETVVVTFMVQGTYQTWSSTNPITNPAAGSSGMVGWTARLTAHLRWSADGTIEVNPTRLKCQECSAPPIIWNPLKDAAIAYDPGWKYVILYLRTPNVSNITTNFSRMNFTVLTEGTDNPTISNTRTQQIVQWFAPSSSQGIGDLGTGLQQEFASLYHPQAIMSRGWKGYNQVGATQQYNRGYWTSPQFVDPQYPIAASVGLTANRVRGGSAQVSVTVTATAEVTAATGYRILRYSQPLTSFFPNVGDRCFVCPMGFDDAFPHHLTVGGMTTWSTYFGLGANTWMYPESSNPDYGSNGVNLESFLNGILNVVWQVEVYAKAGTPAGMSHTFVFPVDTWGDMAMLYGLPSSNYI